MANYWIKIDLLKLQGACVMNLKGRTQTKRCLVVPIDDSHLYLGEKGIYLDLTAIELQNQQYSDTHCLKQQLSREEYGAMSNEERHALPIARRSASNRTQATANACNKHNGHVRKRGYAILINLNQSASLWLVPWGSRYYALFVEKQRFFL